MDDEKLRAALEGAGLRPMGGSLRGKCPFHSGKNATSFSLTPGVGYQCFACGAHGDIRRLAAHLGVSVGERASGTSAAAGGTAPGVVRPLYGLDAAHPYLAARGVDPAMARTLGIGVFRGAGAFQGRVIVPLHDPAGQLVGHLGRAVDDATEPRYRFQRGTPKGRILFNAHRIEARRPVIVVEGVFDLIAVLKAGETNVVALLGSHASRTQMDLLRSFPKVTLLLDADTAGRRGTRDLRRALGERATAVVLAGGDPASCPLDELRTLLIKAHLTLPNTPFA